MPAHLSPTRTIPARPRWSDDELLTLAVQARHADAVTVPDTVKSGIEAVQIRVPATKALTPYLRQRPGLAAGVQTERPPRVPAPTTLHGYAPVRRRRPVANLDPLHDGPSRYWIQAPAGPTFPWERPVTDFTEGFGSTLNLRVLRDWARRYTSGPLRDFALQCYATGFPTLSHANQCLDVSAENKVEPDTPAGDAVDTQLSTLRDRGRLLGPFALPVLPGTNTYQLISVTKLRVNEHLGFKTKVRPVVHGSYPEDGTDRRAWINGADLAFVVPFDATEMAAYCLRHDVVAASLFDYWSFYTTIPKPLNEVASNALFWRGGFHYPLDHLFGECNTPHSGDVHARVLQAGQQAYMDRVSTQRHQIVRRVDDSVVLHPSADMASAHRVAEAFELACAAARQPLQTAKIERVVERVIFDGYEWDFPRKRLGFPRSKQLKLLPRLARCLGIRRAELLGRVPPADRAAVTDYIAAAQLPDRPVQRRDAESLTGSLEYAVTVLTHLRSRIAPIRASWKHLAADTSVVRFSAEATSCLRLFLTVFTKLSTVWVPMTVLFDPEPDIEAHTDASGRHGWGGHTAGLFYATALPPSWNIHLERIPEGLSTAFLELGGLLLLLACRPERWHGRVLRWRTDSSAAVNAWRNGRSPVASLNRLVWTLQRRTAHLSLTVVAVHTPRELNTLADTLSNLQVQAFLRASEEHTPGHRVRPPAHCITRMWRALVGPSADARHG